MKTDSDLLNILRKIYSKNELSQRKLAKDLNFSLGKLNYCLKSLKKKGLIKIQNFKNNENILFSDFHNATDFSTQMVNLLSNQKRAFLLRKNAFEKVKKYKIDNFLSEIFHET